MKNYLKEFFDKLPMADSETGSAVKRSFTSDLGAKLLCVFAAVCLWFYVIDAESTTYKDTFSGVEVQFSTNSRGFEVLSSERSAIEVTLSGKRSVINTMNSSDITATVDISGITEAGEYPLNIIVSTANESSVEDYSPKSIYVYLDKSSSRSVAVSADYTGGTSDDKSLKIGQLETSKNFITIYGPEDALSQVEVAEVTVDLNLISRSVNITNKPLKLISKDGTEINNQYIRMDTSSVDVYVPVYMEKTLPVFPQFSRDYFDADHIACTANPSQVTVRGDVEDVEKLTAVYTDKIDETTIGNSRTLQVGYNLPDGITLVGVRGKCSMVLSVKDYTEKHLTVNYRRINVDDLSDGLVAYPEESVTVKLCGSEDVVSSISQSDIIVSVSASGLEEGLHGNIPVNVSLDPSVGANAFIEEDVHYTSLRVSKIVEEEPAEESGAENE